MVARIKITSNETGLRYQEETSLGVANPSNDWLPLEPNSYADFGGQLTNTARNPINADRQNKKGSVTDLDASGGFNTDLTQDNLEDLMQGFFFADLRRKGEETSTAVVTTSTYNVASTTGFNVGDLIFASGFTDSANNGLKEIASLIADTSITVVETLVNETPPAGNLLVVVGHEFQGAGDADIDAAGTLPALTSTTKDMTEFGLIVGEWMYLGGDTAATQFDTAANNTFVRVRSIATNRIEFDKTNTTMVTEANAADNIRVFFGRVLKNETSGSIVRRSYQLERTLGNPDDALPAEIQAEYLVGSIPNEIILNLVGQALLTTDLSFVSTDHTTIDGPTSLKAGTRPAVVEADPFNTSSDFTRVKMHVVTAGSPNPTALFAFFTEATITISNGVTPDKAVGVLGAIDASTSNFNVTGSFTAYFADVAAVAAVRNNSDVTMDFTIVKQNSGITFDLPLLALGEGRLNVEQNAPVTLPLSLAAATGAKIDTNLNHTAMMVFWDYLPNAADT